MRTLSLATPARFFEPFRGGFDTETRPWQIPPGFVRSAQNYEMGVNGGYQDAQGYERFDGRSKPSDATYWVINVTITGSFSAGDTVTQLVSGATGVVIAVVTSTNPDYIVLTKVSGTFDATNDLQVGAVTQGTPAAAALIQGASTAELHAQYLNLAADEYRDDIGAVPGSGSILGLAMLGDVWYVWRNNAGGTATDVYKSTTGGWTQVALGRELAFTSGGTYTIAEGNTITGATSGATAVITRVMLESGSWASGDAAGKLIFASQTGTFQAENLNVGANLNVATIAGNSSAITLSPGGRYEIIAHNFGGQSGTKRLYGADGVNRGFEFDGSVFCPITTGMTVDTPTHVCAHMNHLFFSFGSSAQHSGIGDPYTFSPLFGAGELAAGDTITGMKSETGDGGSAGSLLILCRNRVNAVYGQDSDNWLMVKFKEEVGAYAYTAEEAGVLLMMDDRGIVTLATSAVHGNFEHASLSSHIKRYINQKKSLSVAACVVREKNQYRVFFSDMTALYVTMNGKKLVGMMPQVLSHTVTCAASYETSSGDEEIMVGCSDGYVRQMEKGTSFDGGTIDAHIALHFDAFNLIRVKKKFLSVTLEAQGSGYAAFDLGYELAYGLPSVAQPDLSEESIDFSARAWDVGYWDIGIWDGTQLSPGRYKLAGSAENISLIISKSSDYYSPMTLTGAMFNYLGRRGLR